MSSHRANSPIGIIQVGQRTATCLTCKACASARFFKHRARKLAKGPLMLRKEPWFPTSGSRKRTTPMTWSSDLTATTVPKCCYCMWVWFSYSVRSLPKYLRSNLRGNLPLISAGVGNGISRAYLLQLDRFFKGFHHVSDKYLFDHCPIVLCINPLILIYCVGELKVSSDRMYSATKKACASLSFPSHVCLS